MNIHNRFGHPDPDDPEVEIEAIERRITDATRVIERRQARMTRYGRSPVPVYVPPARAAISPWLVAGLGILVILAVVFFTEPAPMPLVTFGD